MELLRLMAARAEKRLRSSGGKLRGWVSGSYLCRREEPGSVEWRPKGREDRDFDSRAAPGDVGREGFLEGCLAEEDVLEGEVFEGEDLAGDLVGDDDSERVL